MNQTQGVPNGKAKTGLKAPPQAVPSEVMAEAQAEKQIVTRQSAQVSTEVVDQAEQEVLNSDIVIPKVLLMQGLSPLVADEGKFQMGDIVKSITENKIGDDKTPIQFIPLKMTNVWVVKEKVGEKFEFRNIEARTAANEDLPWQFVHLGNDWKRVKSINVFGLLPTDIEAFEKEVAKIKAGDMPDLDKTLLPVLISFQSTSYKAGQAIATHFTKIRTMKAHNPEIAPFKYQVELSCYRDKNDSGTYMVWQVGKASIVKKEFQESALKWFTTLNSAALGKLKVDTSDEESGSSAPRDVSEVKQF